MTGVFWLAKQGLYVPIAISSLMAIFVTIIIKVLDCRKMKGDGAMENKMEGFKKFGLEVLFTISVNLACGTLLAKAFQFNYF